MNNLITSLFIETYSILNGLINLNSVTLTSDYFIFPVEYRLILLSSLFLLYFPQLWLEVPAILR